jgi:hypothetical protein
MTCVAVGLDREPQACEPSLRAFGPVPQLLKNVQVGDTNAALNAASVLAAIGAAEKKLGQGGRNLVRESGTDIGRRASIPCASVGTACSSTSCDAVGRKSGSPACVGASPKEHPGLLCRVAAIALAAGETL